MAFKKTVTENGYFYQTQEKTAKHTFTRKADLTVEELTAHMAAPKATGDSFVDYDDDTFIRWTTLESSEAVDVPAGTYTLVPANYPVTREDRLTPTSIRSGEAYIPVGYLAELKADITKFINSKPLYDELGFLYRRGYLIHGPPGNGKTSLIRELTKELPNAYVIWLQGIPEDTLCKALDELPGIKIFIIEEITDNPNFRMSDLLEFLDGENSLSNTIVIATTNYPHNLKENLASRPSRFDVVFEVGNPTAEQSNGLLRLLLRQDTDFAPKDLSFAQLKELVLLHRLHGISLAEAEARLIEHKEAFKNGFMEVKKFGF